MNSWLHVSCYTVDGFWHDWGTWSECSVSCANGTKTRTRRCESPKYGGAECSGSTLDNATCRERHCPGAYKSYSNRPLGYERVYLPLCKVTDTPFHMQGDEMYS